MAVALPPGPRSRVRTTIDMASDYVGAFRRWHERYGDVFCLRDLAGNTTVVLADPKLVRELLSVTDPEQFGPNTPESLDVLVGRHSLLMRGGASHQRERKPDHIADRLGQHAVVRRTGCDVSPFGVMFGHGKVPMR